MTAGFVDQHLGGVPGSVPIGLSKGANTAHKGHLGPDQLVTKPLDAAGNLPGISSLPSVAVDADESVGPAEHCLKRLSPNSSGTGSVPGTGTNNKPSSSAGTGTNAVKNFTDRSRTRSTR